MKILTTPSRAPKALLGFRAGARQNARPACFGIGKPVYCCPAAPLPTQPVWARSPRKKIIQAGCPNLMSVTTQLAFTQLVEPHAQLERSQTPRWCQRGFSSSKTMNSINNNSSLEAIASRLKAIALRLEAIAIRLKDLVIRLEAIAHCY